MQTDFFLPLLCEMHSSSTLSVYVQCKKRTPMAAPQADIRGLCHKKQRPHVCDPTINNRVKEYLGSTLEKLSLLSFHGPQKP